MNEVNLEHLGWNLSKKFKITRDEDGEDVCLDLSNSILRSSSYLLFILFLPPWCGSPWLSKGSFFLVGFAAFNYYMCLRFCSNYNGVGSMVAFFWCLIYYPNFCRSITLFLFFGQILGFQLHVLSIYNALILVACSLNFWRHRKTTKSFLKKYLGTSYYNLVFQVNYICCINLNGKKQKIDTWLNLSLVHFMKETWRDTFIHWC
jgi:hypothetical protein